MLRCVAQKHTGITGNEHLSPAKRYGEVRNKTQFAFSVAKSFCCRVISWFKITVRGDPCHAGPGLLCSGSPTLYLAIVAVHPKYPKFSTMGENWVKHLETIDIYWYLLISIDVQIWRSPPIGGLFWQQIGSFCIMLFWHEQEARWKAAVCPEIELFLHLACKLSEIMGIRDFTNRNAEKQYSIKHHQTHFDLD